MLYTDVGFPSINPNDILTVVVHFRDRQSSELSIGAYNAAISFPKYYIAEFCRSDIEFAHFFRMENILAKITTKLLKAQILAEGPIKQPELDYFYLKKKTNRKELFRVLDKDLVPIKMLQKFISNAAKRDSSEHVKKKFIDDIRCYIEVQS